MPRWKIGLYLSISAGIFVVLILNLVTVFSQSTVAAQTRAPAQQEEPAQQNNQLFIPFTSEGSGIVAAQGNSEEAPRDESTDQAALPESGPIEMATPEFHTFAEYSRGKAITLAGVEIQLPDDAYVDSVILSVSPDPNMIDPPEAPLAVLRRNNSVAVVEQKRGRIYLGEPQDVVRQELDFLIRTLGEDKIVTRYEYREPPRVTPQPNPEVTNAPQ